METLISLLQQSYNQRLQENSTTTEDKSESKEKKEEFKLSRELIGIIGALCVGNKACQDEVRKLQGIQLILNHCHIDDQNPYSLEWSIFAIKNITENNPENQEVIKQLKQEGIAPKTNEELSKLGLSAELGKDGKVKITKVDF